MGSQSSKSDTSKRPDLYLLGKPLTELIWNNKDLWDKLGFNIVEIGQTYDVVLSAILCIPVLSVVKFDDLRIKHYGEEPFSLKDFLEERLTSEENTRMKRILGIGISSEEAEANREKYDHVWLDCDEYWKDPSYKEIGKHH
jgi:hypothetical protein